MNGSLSAKATAFDTQGFVNPAYSAYFADPFVFRANDCYFAIGTCSEPTSRKVFPMLRSHDFIHWERIENALVRPVGFGSDYWAPEIAFADGHYFLYYSVGNGDKNHVLRVAISRSPEGPYMDTGTPLLDPKHVDFAIDASPFQDRDGTWYLYYARDFLDSDQDRRSGTAIAVAPLIDMVSIPGDFTVVMRAHHDWQRYLKDRSIHGGCYDWHTLGGPCMVTHEGRYYCLYSGGNWQNDTYGIDFAVSDHPTGPFEDTNGDNKPRVLQTVPGHVIGPGHNSVVTGPDGQTQFVAYHAWDKEMSARRLCFDQLAWTPTGPICLGPTWNSRNESS